MATRNKKVDFIPLVRATDYEGVRTLLCQGVDPNTTYKGQTALMHAAEIGDVPMMEMLIQNGAAINAQDRYGRTPLHCAVRFGHTDAARLLIAAGANDAIESFLLGGETPLGIARAKGHLDIIKMLLYGQEEIKKRGEEAQQPARVTDEAKVEYGTRCIAAGGAIGATTVGRYTPGVDAPPRLDPIPAPPPFAAAPRPVVDEARRLVPPPRY